MPIYEFRCRRCGRQFETLVRGAAAEVCEQCTSTDLERLPSSFAASSAAIRKATLKAVRERGARLREEQRHDDHRSMHRHMNDH